MEHHGGTIKAQSDGAGKGSTFTVDIPVRVLSSAEEETGVAPVVGDPHAEPLPKVRLDGLRVLIVDDEPIARRALLRILQNAGAIALAAESAAEALRLVMSDAPEVLVSDIAMPGTDGYDLIRQVRAAGFSVRDLPAVALTAFAHKEDRRRALLAGFQVHVAKPVDPQDLMAVIGSLMGRTGVA